MPDHIIQDEAAASEEATWAFLCSKLEAAAPHSLPVGHWQETLSSTSLSKSVLAVASHLANDGNIVFEDPHLSMTQRCKIAYAGQRPFDILVIKAQGQKVCEPVGDSIWRLVILDKYVNFKKLVVCHS